MYKGNGIDSKLPRDLKRPGVAYVEGGGVCANITAYFCSSSSRIDAIVRRGPPVSVRKVEVVRSKVQWP